MNEDYQRLLAIHQEMKILNSLDYLLIWDSETYMPHDAVPFRSKQKEFIAKLSHERLTSQTLKSILEKCNKEKRSNGFDNDQKIAIERIQEDVEKATKLPSSLVEEIARVTSEGMHVWAKARKNNDFQSFLPYLEKIFSLNRKKAELLGYKNHPYEPLLDEFEPRIEIKTVDELFSTIQPILTKLVKKAPKVDTSCLYGSFDVIKQKEIAEKMLKAMGHRENGHRLDLSTHPFCLGMTNDDVRMTTRINSSSFIEHILATLHEGGHGLYEANVGSESLPPPLSRYLSIAMHESQSKIWECNIGMNKAFWEGFFPDFIEAFPSLESTPFDDFYSAINDVKPSFIRVEADEVSYCLHIILRYEIEKGMIDETLSPKDLPDIWAEKMQNLFGITPESDAEGCLQDSHWSMGAVGYFPTYALGCFYAAQLFESLAIDFPDYEKRFRNKELLFIKEWLNEKIHKYGRKFFSEELMQNATGKDISADSFVKYIQRKYG